MSRMLFQGLLIATATGFAWPVTEQAQSMPPPKVLFAAEQQPYSESDLRNFVAARAEIDPIQTTLPALPASRQAQAEAQIDTILARHHLTRDDYASIASEAMADPNLNARINGIEASMNG